MKEKKTKRGGRDDRVGGGGAGVQGGESQVELHHTDGQRDGKFHLINPVRQSEKNSKWKEDSVCAWGWRGGTSCFTQKSFFLVWK